MAKKDYFSFNCTKTVDSSVNLTLKYILEEKDAFDNPYDTVVFADSYNKLIVIEGSIKMAIFKKDHITYGNKDDQQQLIIDRDYDFEKYLKMSIEEIFEHCKVLELFS
jgi:hypothetical protein